MRIPCFFLKDNSQHQFYAFQEVKKVEAKNIQNYV